LTDDLAESLATAWGDGQGRLIAQTFGGMLWGRMDNRQLELATNLGIPALELFTPATLVSLRLFDPHRELRIWRRDSALGCCLLREDDRGTDYADTRSGRYVLHLPAGLPEIAAAWFLPPTPGDGKRTRPAAPGHLSVKHYCSRDPSSGLLRLAEHRLLDIQPPTRGPQ
jgi:hypothetical protein